jgi:hypothetical protein
MAELSSVSYEYILVKKLTVLYVIVQAMWSITACKFKIQVLKGLFIGRSL